MVIFMKHFILKKRKLNGNKILFFDKIFTKFLACKSSINNYEKMSNFIAYVWINFL